MRPRARRAPQWSSLGRSSPTSRKRGCSAPGNPPLPYPLSTGHLRRGTAVQRHTDATGRLRPTSTAQRFQRGEKAPGSGGVSGARETAARRGAGSSVVRYKAPWSPGKEQSGVTSLPAVGAQTIVGSWSPPLSIGEPLLFPRDRYSRYSAPHPQYLVHSGI